MLLSTEQWIRLGTDFQMLMKLLVLTEIRMEKKIVERN